ncbi:hypothetical protein [Bradyrhizobium cenepequi]|uniref:hypothetical protein n=1 Tax=Bradyrhizobium cenepequi TaxID=2821403 RepID=UPI001CE32F54|nr:hypothetical protein [Bradyrhizobium cenepequi]MCA6108115.1 hypothetical protein [Bradyrhizobium cenepequi]
MAKHADEAQDRALFNSMFPTETIKVDPAVRDSDLILRGEPKGSVPLERTMAKPRAYSPATKGPK